jgi:light-harvesting complex I chlorophyll a/b binding protein 1
MLAKFREAELIHARWAMLGVAGMLAVEVLGYGNWLEAPIGVRTSFPPPRDDLHA